MQAVNSVAYSMDNPQQLNKVRQSPELSLSLTWFRATDNYQTVVD